VARTPYIVRSIFSAFSRYSVSTEMNERTQS